MNLADKEVLVVGMARSGLAAADALVRKGARVTICDRKQVDTSGEAFTRLRDQGVQIHNATYPRGKWDLVVVSPGVPMSEEPVARALAAGTPVWGELELAYRIKSPAVNIAAITGTNGKTTTTSLLGEILSSAGIPSAVAGNIGVPLISVLEELAAGWVSCEVSSFQLETIQDFHPQVAGIINITPDHLDRHHTLEEYVRVKARIFENQTPEDVLVLNYDDELVRSLARKAPSRVIFYSQQQELPGGVYVRDGVIYSDYRQAGEILAYNQTRLRGSHNLENVLTAVAMALAAGVDVKPLRQALISFSGVRHRMEEVATRRGVLYVNDSKGTNPDSTIKALLSFHEPVVLIAGGRHKGGDLNDLAALIQRQVRVLVLLGEARNIIKEKMESLGYKSIIEVDTLPEAVQAASAHARPGEVVLLSPACASWDMFANYEERGDLFCSLVRALPD